MKRLVVFDDEYVVVQGVRAMIKKLSLNFEIVGEAYDGVSALEVLENTRPDVIMTDIRMPGYTGLELLEKAKDIVPEAVCIIISGYQEFEYARKALHLGVKDYIDKPITLDKVKKVFLEVEQEIDERVALQGTHKQRELILKLSEEMTQMIKKCDIGDLEEKMEEYLELNKYIYTDLDQYRLESYKMICSLLGVFYEDHTAYEVNKHFPSYANLKLINSYVEADEYILIILNEIIEKIKVLNTGSHHQIIIKMLDYIAKHYDSDFGLNEMADMVNMNPNYLSNLFKEEVGNSFVKYLTQIRIEKAKQLLLEGEKIANVSKMVGFNNYRYFCEIFKRYETMTPSEYKGIKR
ncbi:MAG: response regulator [Vallitaleaceae bacterium]|nr:response regulator [Vallitaleaceae bacterium]